MAVIPAGDTRMRNIVVIGGSAGSVPALQQIVHGFPEGLPAAVFVTIHLAPYAPSMLDMVLAPWSALRVSQAQDGEPITPGRVYLARPDHHLILEADSVRVTRGPRENRSRPAVDPLFRSAAYHHGARVIGVVLSGLLDDGTAGLWTVKDRGGLALVQDPADAQHASMSESAKEHVAIDGEAPADRLADLISRGLRNPVAGEPGPPDPLLQLEQGIAASPGPGALETLQLAKLTPYTCPECRGVLAQLRSGSFLRFRCHTGHAYSAGTLLASLDEKIEDSLWNVVRALEEKVLLLNHLASHLTAEAQAHEAHSIREITEAETRRLAALRRQVYAGDQTDAGVPGSIASRSQVS